MTFSIKYGDVVIHYTVIKSNRTKTSQITVSPDGVTVRTPHNKPRGEIQKMLQGRAQWIYRKQLQFKNKQRQSFALGSQLLVLGRPYKIRVVSNSTKHTRLHGRAIEFHITQKKHTTKQIREQYQEYLEKRADSLLPKLVREVADDMGIVFAKIALKRHTGIWGSATHMGDINLNYSLMIAPTKVIRYVVIHELCHLNVKRHSPQFWRMVAKHMPDYGLQIQWLEENGNYILYHQPQTVGIKPKVQIA